MRKFIILPLLLLPTLAMADPSCKFEAARNLDLKLDGVRTLELDMGAYDLHVDAAADAHGVAVRGRACASERKLLDDLTITQQRQGDRLIVKAEGRSDWNINLFGSHYASLDVRVHMPDTLPLIVKTGSGDAEINGVASVRVHSGSGDVNLAGIKGAVHVETGSGDLVADGMGSLQVDSSGSGDLRVRDVRGDAHIQRVGSGDVTLGDVGGAVKVDHVGSGDINLRHVKGSVEIGSIGSGDVDADDIGGDFSVRSHGSGDIHHRDVKGKVDVPDDN